MDKPTLSPWQRVAALTVESLYFLPAFTLRCAEWLGWWMLPSPAAAGLIGGSWLLQFFLLPPLRLGRVAWYRRLVTHGGIPPLSLLSAGFRRLGAAVSWRCRLWARRWRWAAVCAAPSALLWGLAAERSGTVSLAWAFVGLLALLLGAMATALLWGRYAPAAWLILDGQTAGAALHTAPRLLQGQWGPYLQHWGDQAGRIAACLLILPLPFLLPALRCRHAREMESLLKKQARAKTAFRTCILPSTPI